MREVSIQEGRSTVYHKALHMTLLEGLWLPQNVKKTFVELRKKKNKESDLENWRGKFYMVLLVVVQAGVKKEM